MTRPPVIIRHIAFTGAGLAPAEVLFDAGLNVVYGASNTGKSFTLKSIDNMLGSEKPLPNPKLRQGYDSVWLGLEFQSGHTCTIYRAANGGDFLQFDGLVRSHSGTVGHPVVVNDLILGAAKLLGKKVVDNQDGRKQSLTIRTLAPHLIVSETAIIDERSPIFTGQYTSTTAEKNIFRLLLTGTDDATVVGTEAKKTHKARSEAKIELVDELVASVDQKLGDKLGQRHQVSDQLEKLNVTVDEISLRVQAAQTDIDRETAARRDAQDRRQHELARLRELEVTVIRFKWLLQSYASDVERLEALEEAGSLLALRSGRPCSLCGASAQHHTHPQTVEGIEQTKTAATAELKRVRRDRRDLEATIASLSAECDGLSASLGDLATDVERISKHIADLRPNETALRGEFQEKWDLRNTLLEVVRRFGERDELLNRKKELEAAAKRKSSAKPKLIVGIDGPTAHAFSKVVQEVLRAWNFPGNPEITFDDATQDIRVNGQDRKDNGKGVRAILHAAFKVALLIYCQRNDLNHPGFLILDTPLLTYRDPLVSRHGDLQADEQQLKGTRLNEAFYAHLNGLSASVQLIVLENEDPPQSIKDLTSTQVFEGTGGTGRVGFFPPRPAKTT
jgi:hypothetical protein